MILQSSLTQPKVMLYKLMLIIIPFLAATMALFAFQEDFPSELRLAYSGIVFLVLLFGYQLFTSLRPLMQPVTLFDDRLTVKSAFRGKTTEVKYTDIDGFKKQLVPGNRKAHITLLIISRGKRAAEISGLFTSNVGELEKVLGEKITYLGKEPHNVLKNMWDRMLWR